jgi:hypothetical protein
MRALMISSVLFLSGCEKIKEGFGLTHNTPDELALHEQPDLIVPPLLSKNHKENILKAEDILKRR